MVSKADLPDADELREQLAEELDEDVLIDLAVTGQGLDTLVRRIVATIDRARAVEADG